MLLESPPSEINSRNRALNRKAHDSDIAEFGFRQTFGECIIHPDGRLIEISAPSGWEEYETPKGKRGSISHFSSSARYRQMTTLAKIRRDASLPVFLTLTYPAQFPSDWKEWKKHNNSFWTFLKTLYPQRSAMWKLEPQHRDAPHFHALVWNVKKIPWQWLSVIWARIIHDVSINLKDCPVVSGKIGASLFRQWVDELNVSEICKDSLNAGTSIEKIESWGGVAFYVAKYLGKLCGAFEGGSGRFWGIVGKASMPFSVVETIILKIRTALIFKRMVRRFLQSKLGKKKISKGWKCKLITSDMANWMRVGELCCDLAYPQVVKPF